MLDSLYRKLETKATWAIVVLLFVAYTFCSAGFEWRRDALGCENKPLDGRMEMYCPGEVVSLFKTLENTKVKLYATTEITKLNLYAITELTLDIVFPFVYSMLLVFLIVRLYSAEKAKYLILIPIFAALADLSENFTVAYLAFTFYGSRSPLMYLAVTFTSLKTALLLISLGILVVGAIGSLRQNKNAAE